MFSVVILDFDGFLYKKEKSKNMNFKKQSSRGFL